MTARVTLIQATASELPVVDGITIDEPHAGELDDAVWLDEQHGLLRVTVCIADVAGSVLRDDALDLLALERGFTRYYGQRGNAMLGCDAIGKQLSLQQGELRAVLCIRILLDEAFEPVEVETFRARLSVTARLSQTDVRAVVAGEGAD